ncbi:site-specific DNA-methyltransferase [Patescibacteria group bacterium]|nr:site-specific DNA-methyltransferase [Patescibacteria group bacterium]
MTKVIDQKEGKNWKLYHGDAVEVVQGLPDNSIGFTIFSPAFASLYTYSNSDRDMGNTKNDGEFHAHFGFIVEQLYRVTKPGREVAFHCMNIPAMKERDGFIGLKDFRGDLIRAFQMRGFIFHSEHCIWKDPLIEATRTKALGLMHKQLCKDSAMCRAGIPDYLVAMRKPGENPEPVAHECGLSWFHGDDPPHVKDGVLSHNIWRRYASPVWMDIRQSHTLNKNKARDERDEKHICPLQLDVIARGLTLWSNPGDVILSPFCGIGSEGYQAVKMGRRFLGVELKYSYYREACHYLKSAEESQNEMLELCESENDFEEEAME